MTNTKKKLGLAAILVGLVTAGAIGVASADNGAGDGADRQSMHDAWKAKREARKQEILAKYDVNKDGVLDESEKAAMKDDLAKQRFAELDTNHDGVITLDELKAGMAKMKGHRFGRGGHRFGRGFRRHGRGGMGGAGGAPPSDGGSL